MHEGHHHGEGYGCGQHGSHAYHEGDCGCGCSQHHGHHTWRHCHCCCCQPVEGHFRRRFRSRAEQIAELEEYLKELEAEAQGVREALEALRSGPGGGHNTQ